MKPSGFGTVELLIVIAIIGILAGLILASTDRSRREAHDVAIENAIRQFRWQAEIVFDSQGNSFQNWSSNPTIVPERNILLEEVDKHYPDPPGSPYVTILRDSQDTEFCASAPSRAEPGLFICIDAIGELQKTTAHCPDNPAGGAPLRCP